MQKPGVSIITSTLNVLPQSPYQPVNIKYPKTNVDHTSFQPAWYSQCSWLHYLPISDYVICHTCAIANLKRLLHLGTRSESSFCLMGLEIGKMLCAKQRVSLNMRACCHKYAVTLLTQPGHADEQLKEQPKSQKEENQNCFLEIVQSISYLSC